MRPLKVIETATGKEREIPIRSPSPLQVLAYLRGADAVDATHYLLAFIGELGGAKPRYSGESHLDYAQRVADELSWTALEPLVRAADLCWGDAIRESGVLPKKAELDEAGKSSTGTVATPSSSP